MNKEYTYSMPQSFLADKSVPVRWRVWAVINGFFIAGKEFWASNDWIGEQIGCHKDSVSQGVKELEDLGMMHSKRTRRSRVIYPGNGEIGGSAYLRPSPAPISDRSERLSISDSISDSNVSALEDEPRAQAVIEVSEDSDADGNLKRAVPGNKRKAYDELIAWAEHERGFPFLKTMRTKQYKAFQIANREGIKRERLIERWENMSADKFWRKNGFDWMNVVDSFNTKPHE